MTLIGRAHELARLEAQLESAREGVSAVLVVHGPAGIGKTTLMDAAVAAAPDFHIVRVAGVESEMELGFAALHRLLVPFLGDLDQLPGVQRRTLEATFGLGDGPPGDRFLVGLAALTLLAGAAADQPVLCVIDDAHWVDRESMEVLSFVGRRLQADRVVLLFANRDPEDGPADLPEGLPEMAVTGLAEDDARTLLEAVAHGALHEEVTNRLVAATAGSPLAIVELVGELSSEQLAGSTVIPEPIPVGVRLESHFLAQVRGLPEPTQLLLLLAAAEPSGDPALLWRAAADLGLPADASEPAEERGLLTFAPSVAFRHPLIRSAIYGGASPTDTRRVHRALASVIDRQVSPDRWAWHLASASVGPDEDLAIELERSADRARDRGGFAAEARFRARAAELTPDPRRRAGRMLAAAQSSLTAGAPLMAATLLEHASPGLDDPVLLAHARRLEAGLQSFTAPGNVPAVLLAAAQAMEGLDLRLARDTYAEAIQACMVSCQLTAGTTPSEVARAALAAPGGEQGDGAPLADILLEGFGTRLAVGYAEAVPPLRRALAALSEGEGGAAPHERWAVLANNLAAELWEADLARRMLATMEQVARDRGALETLRITLGGIAHCEMWDGRFAVAEACHTEAAQIAIALGADPMAWEILKVELYAWQGREDETRGMAELLTGELAASFGAGVVVNIARMSLAVLDLGLGRYDDAFASAWIVFEDDPPPQGNKALPEVVEAGARCGEIDAAHAALERLTDRAVAAGTPWSLGLLARSRAILAPDDLAESLYIESIDHLGGAAVATDLARSHLVYGEWLRRQNRRVDAREQLRVAHRMFETMGATLFAERARNELAATGEYARKRSIDTANDLTPQESQIALLAASGATNPEIATKLFISASTVDYHLRKVFRKVGVSSRRQLVDVLPQ